MTNVALVLTTVPAYSKRLDADALAHCLADPSVAVEAPEHMATFFGEVKSGLQEAFAEVFGISHSNLVFRRAGLCEIF
jgi:hypothetical protein